MAMDRAFVLSLAKDWGVALVLAGAVFVGWRLLSGHAPEVGGTAPDFTLQDVNGDAITLSDLHGQVVVVNFWATWCGPCKHEIPELTQFHDAHPGVAFLGVSVDENLGPQAVQRVADRLGVTYPVLMDPFGVASGSYQVDTLPTTVVIGAHGDVIAARVGTVDADGLVAMVAQDD